MKQLKVISERTLPAPTEVVYQVLADYQNHHPHILPPEFQDVKVVKGGYGHGTEVTFTSLLGGRPRKFHLQVKEIKAGQVLVESDTLSSLVTTMTVVPSSNGSHVIFETVWEASSGIMGLLESLFAPSMMRRLYDAEFKLFEQYVTQQKMALV